MPSITIQSNDYITSFDDPAENAFVDTYVSFLNRNDTELFTINIWVTPNGVSTLENIPANRVCDSIMEFAKNNIFNDREYIMSLWDNE